MKNRFHIRTERKKVRDKMVEYKDNVNENHKPKIDPQKKK